MHRSAIPSRSVFTALALALMACSAAAPRPTTGPSPTTRPGPAERTGADDLIDRLQLLGDGELAVRTDVIAMGEHGEQPMPRGLLKLQDPALTPSAAGERLVAGGVASLPALIAHLDDARPTRAVIHGIMGLTYAAEFDHRADEPVPAGLAKGDQSWAHTPRLVGNPDQNVYPVAVGDVCFDLIGRIVNRSYHHGRSVPSAVVIVNSPVLCPDLRRALADRWGGLTADRHRAGLVDDVTRPDNDERARTGIGVLARYYPAEVPAAVRARLAVPTYDYSAVDQFIKELFPDGDAADRRRRINAFVTANGPAARDGLALQLWQQRFYYKAGEPASMPGSTVRAAPAEILVQLLGPGGDQHQPAVQAVDFTDTASFVARLKDLGTPPVWEAVWEEFLKRSRQHGREEEGDRRIAGACAYVLAGHGHVEALRAFRGG